MSFIPGSSGGIGSSGNSSGGELAQHQQHIQQHQAMIHQQQMMQQYGGQPQYQYQYQQQIENDRAQQFEEMFNALCRFVLYEHGIVKDKQNKYVRKCAEYMLAQVRDKGDMSEIKILRLLKEYVPTIKFDSEMSELLGDEE